MDEPKPLDSLFKEKLFRVPDYQRGYAWKEEQLVAFWEDLINLPPDRLHYTGILTLSEVEPKSISEDANEFWLIDNHSYRLYDVVDGQQRLTTFIVFLQSYIDAIRSLPENAGKPDTEIWVVIDTLSVADVQEKFLFMLKPPNGQFRTYKFGYTEDNPSDRFMKHLVLGEQGGGTISETFYTLNLSNAKTFFTKHLRDWRKKEGATELKQLYRTLTKRFLFNEYVIKDEFDKFVAFETMNNRGKKLSNLELLKNRLIYLTVLYSDDELDESSRKDLRNRINDAWKEVYHQLGRNKNKPLNDDEFLRAHWIMYFKYSRQSGRDYIRDLLEEQFTPKKFHTKVVQAVDLEAIEEQSDQFPVEDDFEGETESEEENDSGQTTEDVLRLHPNEIRDYVGSLKDSSVLWFQTFTPEPSDHVSSEELEWIQRLNRLQMSYFRPLVMAILKSKEPSIQKTRALKEIERFVFVLFRLTKTRSNAFSSEFNNAVRAIDQGRMTLDQLIVRLRDRTDGNSTTDEGHFYSDEFRDLLQKKFKQGSGYYGWPGLRYFLYEYELSLLDQARQKKVDWSDLLKSGTDRISIEHIYPQTETAEWRPAFRGIQKKQREHYGNSLGNLLLLSSAINASLQNDSFADKKMPKYDGDGKTLRNGYSDGSHSEIEVSRCKEWGPTQIYERGVRLLKFLEQRWELRFENSQCRDELLFIEARK